MLRQRSLGVFERELVITPLRTSASEEIQQLNKQCGVKPSVLEVEGEVRGQDGLFQQLHEVAVLCGRQVAEDVMTLWRHIPGKRESLNIQHSCTQSTGNKGPRMNYLLFSMPFI